MSDDGALKELVELFLKAADDVKKSNIQMGLKIDAIEKALDRQGIVHWEPGSTVNKKYCEAEHSTLEKNVCEGAEKLKRTVFARQDSFEKNVSRRIWWTWVVLVLVIGTIGTVLGLHEARLIELIREVF